jgi:hypothetical protein
MKALMYVHDITERDQANIVNIGSLSVGNLETLFPFNLLRKFPIPNMSTIYTGTDSDKIK